MHFIFKIFVYLYTVGVRKATCQNYASTATFNKVTGGKGADHATKIIKENNFTVLMEIATNQYLLQHCANFITGRVKYTVCYALIKFTVGRSATDTTKTHQRIIHFHHRANVKAVKKWNTYTRCAFTILKNNLKVRVLLSNVMGKRFVEDYVVNIISDIDVKERIKTVYKCPIIW